MVRFAPFSILSPQFWSIYSKISRKNNSIMQMNWAIFFILFSQQNNVFSQDFFSVFLLRRKRGLRTPPFYFGTFCFHGLKAFLLPSLCLMPGKHVCRIYCKTWWDVSVLKAFIKSVICIYKKYEVEWESCEEEKYQKENFLLTLVIYEASCIFLPWVIQ